jgi:hypothetical protein
MFSNFWHKKEKPLMGLTGLGGGAAGYGRVGAGDTFYATGGTKTYEPGPNGPTHYTIHTFQNPASPEPYSADYSTSFVVETTSKDVTDFEYLVVGGGGGGGRGFNSFALGGGGGAGGYRAGTLSYPTGLGADTYPVQVGAGGINGNSTDNGDPGSQPSFGGKGGDSKLMFPTPVVGSGGGGGGAHHGVNAIQNGASGGGGGNPGPYASPTQPNKGTDVVSPDGISPTIQGYNGADGGIYHNGGSNVGGGGGGSSQAGARGTPTNNWPDEASTGGNGGDGTTNTISGASVTYGGGGGGGCAGSGVQGGEGGSGGGGDGGKDSVGGSSATDHLGGGGGGGGASSSDTPGGKGGTGVVIVKYVGSQ